jgi:catechol-2,3-dioxygenase
MDMGTTNDQTRETGQLQGGGIGVTGVNHVALRVRDLERSADFYKQVLGFTEDVGRFGRGVMAFLRAPRSANHHDLALLQIGPDAGDASPRTVGMFHFALEVGAIEDLLVAGERLTAEGCFESAADHGATKAVYGRDPDGNTFEITWVLPRAEWGDWETAAPIKKPMDLVDEVDRRRRPRAGVAAAASGA